MHGEFGDMAERKSAGVSYKCTLSSGDSQHPNETGRQISRASEWEREEEL